MTFEWLWCVCAFPSSIPINLFKKKKSSTNTELSQHLWTVWYVLSTQKSEGRKSHGSSTWLLVPTSTLGHETSLKVAMEEIEFHNRPVKGHEFLQLCKNGFPALQVFLWPKKLEATKFRWTEKSQISNSWRATILRWTKIRTNRKINILNQKNWWCVSRCSPFPFGCIFVWTSRSFSRV